MNWNAGNPRRLKNTWSVAPVGSATTALAPRLENGDSHSRRIGTTAKLPSAKMPRIFPEPLSRLKYAAKSAKPGRVCTGYKSPRKYGGKYATVGAGGTGRRAICFSRDASHASS